MTFIADAVDNKSIVKSELIRRISEKCKDSHPKDIEMTVKHILDRMVHRLKSGGRIEIRGFGAFSLRRRASRAARNPKNGEEVITPEKYILYFRAGKEFKGRINTKQQVQKETAAEEVFM